MDMQPSSYIAMEPCYEYLGCPNRDCVMNRVGKTERCWLVEGTMCNHHGIELVRQMTDNNKEAACARSSCIYYKYAKGIGALR